VLKGRVADPVGVKGDPCFLGKDPESDRLDRVGIQLPSRDSDRSKEKKKKIETMSRSGIERGGQ
jgi:hypothetical protein